MKIDKSEGTFYKLDDLIIIEQASKASWEACELYDFENHITISQEQLEILIPILQGIYTRRREVEKHAHISED